MRIKVPVPGRKNRTNRMLLNIDVKILFWYANIPCGEKIRGRSTQITSNEIKIMAICVNTGFIIEIIEITMVIGMVIAISRMIEKSVRNIVLKKCLVNNLNENGCFIGLLRRAISL